MKEFSKLVSIMKKLIGPNGCPWDLKQNHLTLLKYLREESEEFITAVKKKDYENMKEELGDILLQVVFHSALAEREGKFSIREVVTTLNEKLIRRHPHVFKNRKKMTEEEVLKQWREIKKREKNANRKKTRQVNIS